MITLLMTLFFSVASTFCMEQEDARMNKRSVSDDSTGRNIRRHVELNAELKNQIQTLLEHNKFDEYFQLIDSLDEDAQKLAYELEFMVDQNYHKSMHWAAFHDNVDAIKELYRRGVSVNVANRQGHTALCSAAFHNKIEAARCLLDLDASLEVTNGASPMHWAAKGGSVDILKLLKEAGGNVNLRLEAA